MKTKIIEKCPGFDYKQRELKLGNNYWNDLLKKCSDKLNDIVIWVWIISYGDLGMFMLTCVFVFVRKTTGTPLA